MSDHEFEKQVRQKLNDLKMTPSAGSWEGIEDKLRERKRRPVAFYWVPLLLLGLAAGGYVYFNNEQKTVLSDRNSTNNVKDQTKVNDGVASEQNNDRSEILTSDGENDENTRLVTPGSEDASGNVLKDASGNVLKDASGKVLKDASGNRLKNAQQKNINPSTGASTENKTQNPVEESNSLSIAPGKVTHDISLKNSPKERLQNNPQGRKPSLKISDFPIGTVNSASLSSFKKPAQLANKKSQVNKINKWSYGISAFAGVTAVNEGHILNFNNAQVEDVSAVPDFAPRQPYKPSSISPGFSFSAGAFVKRELSTRFSLSLGINYLQLNTRNKVGSEVNGSQIVNNGARGYMMVANYFTVEQDKPSDYRNRYHFIELPVELHTKLNKSKKLPIHLNTGIAVSQLIKSNSLHFDGTTGIYYRNDKLLNQTQVAARTGISVGVLNKTTRPLWIGPSAKYNISTILQKDVAARKNFMSFGIDVKMFIR